MNDERLAKRFCQSVPKIGGEEKEEKQERLLQNCCGIRKRNNSKTNAPN